LDGKTGLTGSALPDANDFGELYDMDCSKCAEILAFLTRYQKIQIW